MTALPLRLGPLAAPGFLVQRSGVRWLYEDGHRCRPGEVVAFCNIGLMPDGSQMLSSLPFADEARDFQVAFAPRAGGTLRIAGGASHGGFLDQHQHYQFWTPDFVIGHIEDSDREDAGDNLRLLFLAGRRMTELAEIRSGLLTGWHASSRAWWGDDAAAMGTLLSLGICEQVGVIRGEKLAFLEMFEAVPGSAQAIFVPDDSLVICAPIALEQLHRDPAGFHEIAADLASTFPSGAIVPAPADWVFAGALLTALQASPLTEPRDILTRTGLRRSGTASAVILSIHAEPPMIMRHRRLGYALHLHSYRVAELGPAMKAWLRANFEPVPRTIEDISEDYRRLIDAVRERSAIEFLILNAMSSSGPEDIFSYAPFDRPMGNILASIRNKELNLMLHDLARDRDIAIIDVDAIGAEMGHTHLPEGIHQSGAMQAEIRGEILRILRERRIPGFS